MTLSNIHDILPIDTRKRLHFIKDEEGEWKAHVLSEQEREEKQHQDEIKERGICIVHIGHAIGHVSERILEALSAHHDLPLQVVILSEEEHIPSLKDHPNIIMVEGKGYVPFAERYAPPEDVTLAGLVQHMNDDMLLEIKRINDDIQNIFLDLKTKPYHSSVNYAPKTQKSKAKVTRKNNQKKK